MLSETEIESSEIAQVLNDVEIVKQDFEAEDEKLRQWRINLRLIRQRWSREVVQGNKWSSALIGDEIDKEQGRRNVHVGAD